MVYVEETMDVDGNGFAAVIPMAEEGSDWMGADCVITGWGRTETWGSGNTEGMSRENYM